MKAMILAAGFGTRLHPITQNIPKALAKIENTTLLELLILRLKYFGFNEFVINTHHHSEQILKFINENNYFDCSIKIIVEKEILGTGGGLQNAADYLNNGDPFLVHNVDIISDLNYTKLIESHQASKNLVTLCVKDRVSSRSFLVNNDDLICGHQNSKTNVIRIKRDFDANLRKFAFCGIHLISPQIFKLMNKDGFYSIIDLYLELIEKNYSIGIFEMKNNYWKDIGRLENLREMKNKLSDPLLRERLFPFLNEKSRL